MYEKIASYQNDCLDVASIRSRLQTFIVHRIQHLIDEIVLPLSFLPQPYMLADYLFKKLVEMLPRCPHPPPHALEIEGLSQGMASFRLNKPRIRIISSTCSLNLVPSTP